MIQRIETASEIWNYALALRRRYYQRFKKFLGSTRLQSFIAKLIKRTKFANWKSVGSQAVQDIIQRMDRGYARFFDELAIAKVLKKRCKFRPPRFKSRFKYKSFTLKQAGYKYTPGQNSIQIGNQTYKFHDTRI